MKLVVVALLACVALLCASTVVQVAIWLDDDEPETVQTVSPITALPCSATSPLGQNYDPCGLYPDGWRAAFWNPLQRIPYFTKWTTANPGEWAMLNAYLRNGQPYSETTQPTVKTAFGGIVRFGIIQCKAWVNNPASCP